jgi:hypothetical protein
MSATQKQVELSTAQLKLPSSIATLILHSLCREDKIVLYQGFSALNSVSPGHMRGMGGALYPRLTS